MATKISKDDILEGIANLCVLELSELLKEFEEKFGVTAAAPVAVAPRRPPAAGTPRAATRRRPSSTSSSPPLATRRSRSSRRSGLLTSLGLKEAKDLVDSAPKPVLERVVEGGRRQGQGPARGGRGDRRGQVATAPEGGPSA